MQLFSTRILLHKLFQRWAVMLFFLKWRNLQIFKSFYLKDFWKLLKILGRIIQIEQVGSVFFQNCPIFIKARQILEIFSCKTTVLLVFSLGLNIWTRITFLSVLLNPVVEITQPCIKTAVMLPLKKRLLQHCSNTSSNQRLLHLLQLHFSAYVHLTLNHMEQKHGRPKGIPQGVRSKVVKFHFTHSKLRKNS